MVAAAKNALQKTEIFAVQLIRPKQRFEQRGHTENKAWLLFEQ